MNNKVKMQAVFTNHQNPTVRGISKRGRMFSTVRYNYEVGVVEEAGYRAITLINSRNALKKSMARMSFAEWVIVKADIEEPSDKEETPPT